MCVVHGNQLHCSEEGLVIGAQCEVEEEGGEGGGVTHSAVIIGVGQC